MPKHEYGQEGAHLQNEVFKRALLWLAPPVLLLLFLTSAMVLRPPLWVSLTLLLLVPVGPGLAKGWERGASTSLDPHITGFRGERDLADALCGLGADCYLVHDPGFGRGNVDHVAVTPAGIFAIETKAYDGVVWTKGDKLFVNRFEHERDLKQAYAGAMTVRDHLNRVSGGKRYHVTPLLVVSRAKVTSYGKCRGVFVLGIGRLSDFMGFGRHVLDQDQRSAIAAALGTKTTTR